jgi:hypothetical protein
VQRLGKASSSSRRCEPAVISVMRAEAPTSDPLFSAPEIAKFCIARAKDFVRRFAGMSDR